MSNEFDPLKEGAVPVGAFNPENEGALPFSSNQSNKESFTQSLYSAPGKIVEDVGRNIISGLGKIPGYLEKAKTEVPGLLGILDRSAFGFDPSKQLHALGQAGAGISDLGRGMAQLPHDIGKYASERLNLLPENIYKNIPNIEGKRGINKNGLLTTIPIEELVGEPMNPGEELLRGIARNLPQIKLAKEATSLVRPVTKSSIENSLLKPHDTLQANAVENFETVSKEAKNRGVPPVKIDPNFMKSLKKYFPNTDASNNLLNRAKTGDYDALRSLQSDMFENAKNNLSSDLEADRFKGKEALEKRNIINKKISDHFKNVGQEDLANKLDEARADWKTLNEIYYNENLPPSLIKMFNSKIRKIPNNVPKLLKERSIAMDKLKEFHPGLSGDVSKYGFQNKLINLGKVAIPAGAGGVAYEMYRNRGNE